MAPSLLLDTHALLWWLVEPEKLSPLAEAAINDPAATIFVSAASGWELATGPMGWLEAPATLPAGPAALNSETVFSTPKLLQSL